MSQSSDAPPVKRRRLDSEGADQEDITRSDIWHDDGSVVLQAETTQFRVHWGVLSLHSTFFRDMRDLPQPADQPSLEECPAIELHDSAADVKHLLHALYNQLIFSEETTLPLPFIAAIVRMGRKYDFKNLLAAAVQRLTHENPQTLEEYERTTVLLENRIGYSATQIVPNSGLIFDMVTLARENDFLAALPCAYFRLIRRCNDKTILDGIPQNHGPPITLSSLDQRLCIIGSKKLIRPSGINPAFLNGSVRMIVHRVARATSCVPHGRGMFSCE